MVHWRIYQLKSIDIIQSKRKMFGTTDIRRPGYIDVNSLLAMLLISKWVEW